MEKEQKEPLARVGTMGNSIDGPTASKHSATPAPAHTRAVLTREQLIADGCVRNINMPAPGWMYCRVCQSEQTHHAYSHKGTSDCYEVCKSCGCYSGRNTLRQPVRELVGVRSGT